MAAKLTTIQVKNAKPGRYADGNGLYLHVRPGGSKAWVLRLQIDGHRRDFGLGSAERIPLARARASAAEMRSRLLMGEPAREPEPPKIPTFSTAAQACHRAIKDGWSNARHSESWLVSLEQHIFPSIGDVQVDQITTAMVRDALSPIWLTIPETARRILQRIRTVLDYSHISGWCPNEASLRSVPKALPRQPTQETHYVSMPYADVPAFVETIGSEESTPGRDALLFLILTAARSGEARKLVWTELDMDKAVWSVPAERMKMKRLHQVPLSGPAIAILKRRWALRHDDTGFVFSSFGTKPISDMTMTKVLRALGDKKTTVHGFRSSFTDWAAEETDYRKEVVDKALAHKLLDRVEAAYRRTDFFDRRRQLMEDWGAFVMQRATSIAAASDRRLIDEER